MASEVGGVSEGTRLSLVQWVGLTLGIVLFILFLLLPPIAPLTTLGMKSLAVFLLFVCWLATTPMPLYVVSFFCLALFVITGVLSADKAFGYLGYWVIPFLIGAFALGGNLHRTGIARRLALRVCSLPFVHGHPWVFFTVFLLTTGLSGLFFPSPTVSTVVFTSVLISFLTSIGIERGDRFGGLLVLATAWAAVLGARIAPWGAAGTLVGIGITQQMTIYQIGLFEWTMYGLFSFFVNFAVVILVSRFLLKLPTERIAASLRPEFIRQEQAKLGPMTSGEKAAIAYMGVAIVLWFTPELVSMTIGGAVADWMKTCLPWGAVSLVIAALGTLTPVTIGGERRMLLRWGEWVQSMEWGLVGLVAAGVALGDIMSNEASGIPTLFMNTVGGLVQGGGEYLLVFLMTVPGIWLTEPLSNMALITTLLPLGLTLSLTTGIANPVAMAITAIMAYSQSYALPLSPALAVAFGTGWVRPGDAMKLGFLIDTIVGLTLCFVIYTFMKLFIPLPPY